MKKTTLAALLGLLALGAVAIAQVINIPFVTVIHPTTDGIQIIPNGNSPSAQNVYASPAQITNTYGYYKSAPTGNIAYTFGANVTFAAFAPTGAVTTTAITLAAAPSDGARNCFFTTQTMTTVTVSANTGQSINNPITAGVANTGYCWLYSASNSTWDRD